MAQTHSIKTFSINIIFKRLSERRKIMIKISFSITVVFITLLSANIVHAQYYNDITVTNDIGVILSIDTTDWGYSGAGISYQIGDTIPNLSSGPPSMPTVFQIFPPYPNPSTGLITFHYILPVLSHVSLTVHISPQDSIVLVDGMSHTGYYNVYWDGPADIPNGLYSFTFRAGDYTCSGDFWRAKLTAIVENPIKLIPEKWKLFQNYPNPFNPVTTISYQLQKPGLVSITVYNLMGQLVETLVNEYQTNGFHSVVWNAEDLSSGIYFYKIQSGEFLDVNKCVILK